MADAVADAAAKAYQLQGGVLNRADEDFGLAVLLNMRLRAIEAHCWMATATMLVPVACMPALPLVLEIESAVATARRRLEGSRHQHFHHKAGLSCGRCQKYRPVTKAHPWPGIPCIAPRRDASVGQDEAQQPGRDSASALSSTVARPYVESGQLEVDGWFDDAIAQAADFDL